jgi:hypothetical protein
VHTNDGSAVTGNGRDGDAQERLRALQRRAFAVDGDAAGDLTVARAIAELSAQIAAEAGSAADAAAPTPAGSAAGAAAAPVRGTPPPQPADGAVEAPGSAPEPVGTVGPGAAAAAATGAVRTVALPAAARRRRLLLATGLAGALALGGLLGGTVTVAIRPTAPTPTPPEPDAAAGEPVLATAVFTRLQTPKDIPPVAMPDTFLAASFRYLGSAGWTDADADGVTDSPYYAARSASELICLVVVPEGSGYLSTCAPAPAFPSAGLRLSWQSTDLHPGVPDGGTERVLDITVAWLSDATVQTRGTGRPLPPP